MEPSVWAPLSEALWGGGGKDGECRGDSTGDGSCDFPSCELKSEACDLFVLKRRMGLRGSYAETVLHQKGSLEGVVVRRYIKRVA